MTDTSIESLSERLEKALGAIDWMGRKPRPTLRKPATDEEIAAFEADRGVELPETYKTFLRLHNGMEGAEQYDWVIAGVTPVTKGESFEDARSGHLTLYKKKGADHPAVKALEKSIVVGTDFDYQLAFFEPSMLGDDEPKVRRIAFDMEYDEYPLFEDFRQFLEFIVAIYEDLVDMQSMPMEDDLAEQEQMLRELAALLGDSGGGGKSAGGGGGTPAPRMRKGGKKSADTGKPASRGEEAAGGGGTGGGEAGGDVDEGMASLLGAMFAPEPEPEPEPELSPEMKRAAKLCHIVTTKLMEADLLELVQGPGMRENLEDYLLRKLMRSKSPQDAMESWIYALGKAREVEELYGTDEELIALMTEAFEEVS